MQAKHMLPSIDLPSKRRRIEKACDDCRRLKIKCDGLTPCIHCATYERTCTYDIPHRRPKSLAQQARDLEGRLQTIQRLLRIVKPDLDIDNPNLGLDHPTWGSLQAGDLTANCDIFSAAEKCDFPISLRSDFPSLLTSKTQQKPRPNPSIPLPSKDVAYDLLAHALQDACVLHRFVHEPLFYAMVEYIYETPTERLIKDHRNSLALFYAALALGAFFANGMGTNSRQSTAAVDTADGSHYFNLALVFLNLDECQDLVSLQALCFLTIFLQSSGQLELCYSYVGIALRSAVALGLHQRRNNTLDLVEREIKKRVFWVIWRMDVYSSSLLGIPPMLSTDLVDQSLPEPIDDTCSARNTMEPVPTENKLLLIGANAHTSLTLIMPKVRRHIQAFKRNLNSPAMDLQSLMKRSGMLEVEKELRAWFQDLPSGLLPGGEATAQLKRVRQLLRIAYSYVQMVLYEPLLQWMPKPTEGYGDPQIFEYLMRYISVMRNIVSTGVSIHKSHVTNYSSRSTMLSTTYSAILSLIVFVLNIPAPSGIKGVIFQEALEGRKTLEELSSRSTLADRYVRKLNAIFEKFQDRPQLLPVLDPEPLNDSVSERSAGRTELGTDMQTEVIHSRPFRVTARASDEPHSAPRIITASEWVGPSQLATSNMQTCESAGSGRTPLAEFTPSYCNFVSETPYQGPHSSVSGDVNTSVSMFPPATSNTDYRTNQLDELDSRLSPRSNHNLIGELHSSSHSHLVDANVTTLSWPQTFTSDPQFSEYATLVPPSSQENIGYDFPASAAISQHDGGSESVLHMAALPPGTNHGGSIFGSVELAPEQVWDSALVSGFFY